MHRLQPPITEVFNGPPCYFYFLLEDLKTPVIHHYMAHTAFHFPRRQIYQRLFRLQLYKIPHSHMDIFSMVHQMTLNQDHGHPVSNVHAHKSRRPPQ